LRIDLEAMSAKLSKSDLRINEKITEMQETVEKSVAKLGEKEKSDSDLINFRPNPNSL
jgi:hypothetical protein